MAIALKKIKLSSIIKNMIEENKEASQGLKLNLETKSLVGFLRSNEKDIAKTKGRVYDKVEKNKKKTKE